MSSFVKSLVVVCFVLFAAGVMLTPFSCKSGAKCSLSGCVNGGVCNNGKCTCPVGYEGDRCQTMARDAYIGNWTVYDTDTVHQGKNYTVGITSVSTAANEVVIKNLLNFYGLNLNAYVLNDSLIIPYQLWAGASMQGTGYRGKNNTIVINYIFTYVNINLPVQGVTTLHP